MGIKRQYRRDVWATFKRHCPVPMSEAVALILPSAEGDEIATALAAGVREQNVHICDKNAAIVAVLKRRFPLVSTHGIDVARVLKERGHVFHLINLDLCGVMDSALDTLVAAIGAMPAAGCVALTWQKGRDPKYTRFIREALARQSDPERCAGKAHRAAIASYAVRAAALGGGSVATQIRHAQYRSGMVPMEWAAWRLDEAPAMLSLDDWLEAWFSLCYVLRVLRPGALENPLPRPPIQSLGVSTREYKLATIRVLRRINERRGAA